MTLAGHPSTIREAVQALIGKPAGTELFVNRPTGMYRVWVDHGESGTVYSECRGAKDGRLYPPNPEYEPGD